MEYPSSISNIKKYLDSSIKIIQKYQKSGCEIMIALDEERILHNVEMIAAAIRKRLKKRDYVDMVKHSMEPESILVSVGEEAGIIVIRLPELLNRRNNDCWYLRDVVQSQLAVYMAKREMKFSADKRLYLCYVRWHEERLVRRFDNDNTEAHHITDGIATALKLDDNAARIQVLYATLPCKTGEECCKVYIVPGRKIGGFMTKIEES